VTAAIFFTLFGGFLTWIAVLNWRHRREEKISLLEAAILKTTGVEPLPLTKFDRWLQWFQIVMASILGPLLLVAGLAGLGSEIGVFE
jgi:hypothetical protein